MSYAKFGTYNGGRIEEVFELEYLPVRYHSKELSETAVRADGMALKHVLPEFLTEDVCRIAVEQNGEAIRFVPERFRTRELYSAAVKRDGMAVQFIPNESITIDVCLDAVNQNAMALSCVPLRLRSREVCLAAMTRDPKSIQYVTEEEYLTEELCAKAVAVDSKLFIYVPDRLKTEEMCSGLTPFDGIGKFIPERFLTDKLKKKIDAHYEKHYRTIGPIKTSNLCLSTDPCRHAVILEDGSYQWRLSGRKIAEMLRTYGLSDLHFAPYLGDRYSGVA